MGLWSLGLGASVIVTVVTVEAEERVSAWMSEFVVALIEVSASAWVAFAVEACLGCSVGP